MSDTPKFEVIDRRKMKAEEEKDAGHAPEQAPASTAQAEPAPGPRLVVNEPRHEAAPETVQTAEELGRGRRTASCADRRRKQGAESRLRRIGATA